MMFLLILFFVKHVESSFESMIVGGELTTTTVYPYQVFLDIQGKGSYVCGGSLLNQALVLTAAHCLEDIPQRVIIKYGSESIKTAKMRRMKSYRIHPRYNFDTMFADLAIVQCRKPVLLNKMVQRVAIMRRPPIADNAFVAGWGIIDENMHGTTLLKHVEQKIYSVNECKGLQPPNGTFCAGNFGADIETTGYPSLGDSGGPLVISGFIQIGIVSYRVKGQTSVAYTNVSYFLPWIRRNAHELHCG